MKPSKKQKDSINRLVNKWKSDLGLSDWHIEVEFKKDDLGQQNGFATPARIFVEPVYMKAGLDIFPIMFSKDRYEIESCIIHELTHCLTKSLANCAYSLLNDQFISNQSIVDAHENLTQKLAVIFKRLK